MFPKAILNDIKDRISIVAFVGERIPLKRAGRNFKGLCPFHNEKTPSFNVNDEKGIYHCFGCGEGGDLFQFVMKFEGVSFAEAVRSLAGRAGVDLPRDVGPAEQAREEEAARRKRSLLRVNEIARDWFVERLHDRRIGAPARGYLQSRGLSEDIWTQHFLGYADNSWDQLAGHLRGRDIPLELAAEVGLLKRREGGGFYDFFRHRLIFPILSARGEVLGFSGRALEEAEGVAKYVNSPDSPIYHKSNCVYGLHLAANAIRHEDHVILVEGNIDLVALHQAGFANAVAPLGTALTAGHVRLLRRLTRQMTVAFDGDEAGMRASLRSLEVFIEEGIAPRVVPLPAGEDPDSLVRKEGADAFRRRLAAAPPLFEYFVEQVIAETGADAAGKVAAAAKIVPLLRAVADPAERAIYRRHVARRLDLDERSLERSLSSARAPAAGSTAATARRAEAGQEGIAIRTAERLLIEAMFASPEMAPRIAAAVAPEEFEDPWCRLVAGLVRDRVAGGEPLRVGDVIGGVEDAELALLLRQIALEGERWEADEAAGLVDDCIARLKERPSRLRLERINDDIRRAEMEGDEARLLELLAEKRGLAAHKGVRHKA